MTAKELEILNALKDALWEIETELAAALTAKDAQLTALQQRIEALELELRSR